MNAIHLLQHLAPDCKDLPQKDLHRVTENAALADGNSLFVCIKGARFDGHELARVAYEGGCRVFVAERDPGLPADAFVLTVPSTRRAMAILACAFYHDPSHSMRLIGVTGTKGKTTVAHMITHMLHQNGISCGYIGTNCITYGSATETTKNTTPDAMTLQGTLRRMLDAGVHTAVLEISSQALKQFRADGTRFAAVLFTNLFPDHISPNEHADFAEYKACKRRLFTDFDAPLMICNGDDTAAIEMMEDSTASKKRICSLNDPLADYFAEHLQRYRQREHAGISFDLLHQGDRIPCRLPLLGGFNAANALLAMATLHELFGLPLTQLTKSLENVAVPGRGEILPLPCGATAVIDYAHNGGSLRSLLTALREYRPSRLICLFGSVGERTQLRRAELGRVASELCDLCILTADNPGNEPPENIIADIAKAFADKNTPYVSVPDRADAIRYAVSICRPGDILVLAGKGHESYQLIGNQKLPFCERNILAEAAGCTAVK